MSGGRLASVTGDILAARHAGETLQAIGDRFGCTREAIRLICVAHGVTQYPTQRQVRRFFHAVSVAARLELRADNGGTTVPHGRSRYATLGCRCEVCTEANRVHHWKQRHAGDVRAPHGTTSAYKNYGCRCDACKDAGSIDNRANAHLRILRGAS